MTSREIKQPGVPTVSKTPEGDHGGEIEDGGKLQPPKDLVQIRQTGFARVRTTFRIGPVEARTDTSGPSHVALFVVGIAAELGAGGIWLMNPLAGVTLVVVIPLLLILYVATHN